jgi:hypothetical protein
MERTRRKHRSDGDPVAGDPPPWTLAPTARSLRHDFRQVPLRITGEPRTDDGRVERLCTAAAVAVVWARLYGPATLYEVASETVLSLARRNPMR